MIRHAYSFPCVSFGFTAGFAGAQRAFFRKPQIGSCKKQHEKIFQVQINQHWHQARPSWKDQAQQKRRRMSS